MYVWYMYVFKYVCIQVSLYVCMFLYKIMKIYMCVKYNICVRSTVDRLVVGMSCAIDFLKKKLWGILNFVYDDGGDDLASTKRVFGMCSTMKVLYSPVNAHYETILTSPLMLKSINQTQCTTYNWHARWRNIWIYLEVIHRQHHRCNRCL